MSIGQIVALLEPPLDGFRGEKGNSSSATTSSTAFSTEHTAHRLAPTFSHCRVTKDDDARKCGVPLVFSGPSPRVYLLFHEPTEFRTRLIRFSATLVSDLSLIANDVNEQRMRKSIPTFAIYCDLFYGRIVYYCHTNQMCKCSPNRSVRIATKHVRVEACWLNWFE